MDKEEARNALKLIVEHIHLFSKAVRTPFPKNLFIYWEIIKLDKELAKQGFYPATMYPFGLKTIAKLYINDQKEN